MLCFLSNISIGQTADFKAKPSSGCAPLLVSFTNTSSGANSYNWDLGNTNTSIEKDPSATYDSPGTYIVTLTLPNGSKDTAHITVFENPKADFTSSTNNGCVGKEVTFTSTSKPGSNPISTYTWSYGDGFNGTGTPSLHQYSKAGTFPVTLIVTDIGKCSNKIAKDVLIVESPVASFITDATFRCQPPLNVKFTNTSLSGASTNYLWDFGDGFTSSLPSPSHSYSLPGKFTPKLFVTQGSCIDSIKKTDLVKIQDIAADFTVSTGTCIKQNITFTSTVSPGTTNYLWTFGDKSTSSLTNPVHSFDSAGTYSITLLATDINNCSKTASHSITVSKPSLPNFGSTSVLSSCSPYVVQFTDSSENAVSYLWNFGDGSTSIRKAPPHFYADSGSYNVSLTTTNTEGCSNTFTRKNFISINPPFSNFSTDKNSGCIPLTVSYTSTSISSDGIASYDWRYGDGTKNMSLTPKFDHEFISDGTFYDTLIVTSAGGCKDTSIAKRIITGTKPNADFKVIEDTVCYHKQVIFADQSTGSVNSWQWKYGDGLVDSLTQNPGQFMHIYADTGVFNVTLLAIYNGCSDTITYDSLVTILPPKALFEPIRSCTDKYTITFQSNSVKADSLVWKFGDGSIDSTNTPSPSHTYLTRGLKSITLTAFNYKTGCSDSMVSTLTIADPKVIFTPDTTQGCYPLTINFDDSSQDAQTYNWSFGNLKTSQTADTQNTYDLPGKYFVKLTITDINSCAEEKADSITVFGPIPDFSTDKITGCAPLDVKFKDLSVSDSAIVKWEWIYGDNKSDIITTDSVSHQFVSSGTYNISMKVTDKNNCTKSKSVSITPTFPVPSFSTDTLSCEKREVKFDGNGTKAVNPKYYWDFGDGSPIDSSNNALPNHIYNNEGFPIVKLSVKDINGCIDTLTRKIKILNPVAKFSDSIVSFTCANEIVLESVLFKDASTGYISEWKWNFGDGGTSNQQNPSNLYANPGTFPITLVVKNIVGCIDTSQKDSLFIPGPIGEFSFSPQGGCSPHKTTFTAQSNTSTYIWDFGDGVVKTTSENVIDHIYVKPFTGTPNVLLEMMLPDGPCRLRAQNNTGKVDVKNFITVNFVPPVIKAEEGKIIFFDPKIVGQKGEPSYIWSPNNNLSCTNCLRPGTIPTKTGTYHLTVTDSTGCIGENSVLVEFIPCSENIKIPDTFTPNEDGINDQFEIEGDCLTSDYSLQIFNRWGELLFSSTDFKETWNGRTQSGELLSEGTYFYIFNNGNKSIRGIVTLIK